MVGSNSFLKCLARYECVAFIAILIATFIFGDSFCCNYEVPDHITAHAGCYSKIHIRIHHLFISVSVTHEIWNTIMT